MTASDLHDVALFLGEHRPFDELDTALLDTLVNNIRVTYHRRGESLQPANRLYIIRSGGVELRSKQNDLVDRIADGEAFGAEELVTHHACDHASFYEDTLLYQVEEGLFKKLCDLSKPFRRHFSVAHQSRIRLALANRADSLSLTSLIGALIKKQPVCISPAASIKSAAELMNSNRISSLIVESNGELKGMLTDSDMRRRVVAQARDVNEPVSSVMTASPVFIDKDSFVFEAVLKMSRHNIHHLPVLDNGKVAGMVTTTDIVNSQRSQPVYLIGEIWKAATDEQVAAVCASIPDLFVRLVEADARAQDVSRILTAISDSVTQHLIELAEQELGPAPVSYTWLAFGSQAREDQNISSDQDNALLLDNSYIEEQHGPWFAAMTERVCRSLDACGYSFCPGGIMAQNPDWRLTLDQWRARFAGWISDPDPSATMHTSIFFDVRRIHGSEDLFLPLHRGILEAARKNRIFLAHLARNCLRNPPPLGFFRDFVVARSGDHKDELDLKHFGSVPIIDLARLYSLANGISSVNTIDRLRDLSARKLLNRSDVRNLMDASEFINFVRLQNQVQELGRGDKPDNFVAPENLSGLQRHHLKDGFQIIKRSQDLISSSFLGGLA